MHASVHDLEAESLVCALGRLVVDPRVRGDLRAALRTRPVLGCADEGPTDPATLMLRLDVPALDEAHWLAPVAAVRMGAESDLDEACDLPVHLGHEDHERHRAWRAACQDRACPVAEEAVVEISVRVVPELRDAEEEIPPLQPQTIETSATRY